MTKPLPESMLIEDPNGIVVTQKVLYDWKPAFCHTCQKVGHDCSSKPAGNRNVSKKMTKKWVPKKVPEPQTVQVTTTPGQAGGPSHVVTPAVNAQVITSDDDAGWRVVSRKSRDKGKAVLSTAPVMQNSYQVLHDEGEEVADADDGDSSEEEAPDPPGVNPYLS